MSTCIIIIFYSDWSILFLLFSFYFSSFHRIYYLFFRNFFLIFLYLFNFLFFLICLFLFYLFLIRFYSNTFICLICILFLNIFSLFWLRYILLFFNNTWILHSYLSIFFDFTYLLLRFTLTIYFDIYSFIFYQILVLFYILIDFYFWIFFNLDLFLKRRWILLLRWNLFVYILRFWLRLKNLFTSIVFDTNASINRCIWCLFNRLLFFHLLFRFAAILAGRFDRMKRILFHCDVLISIFIRYFVGLQKLITSTSKLIQGLIISAWKGLTHHHTAFIRLFTFNY